MCSTLEIYRHARTLRSNAWKIRFVYLYLYSIQLPSRFIYDLLDYWKEKNLFFFYYIDEHE